MKLCLKPYGQNPEVYFIIAMEKDGKIPKKKPVRVEWSNNKSEEMSKSPDTASGNQAPSDRWRNCER